MLDQFRHDTAPGDQVDHAHVGHADHPLGHRIGDARDPVDHQEGVADQRRLYRGRAAGDDTGAGVLQNRAGIVNHPHRGPLPARLTPAPVILERGGYGQEVFVSGPSNRAVSSIGGKLACDSLVAASRQQANPEF